MPSCINVGVDLSTPEGARNVARALDLKAAKREKIAQLRSADVGMGMVGMNNESRIPAVYSMIYNTTCYLATTRIGICQFQCA
jgi:hypothetical protein